MNGCIVFTGIRLLLLIRPFSSLFVFLANFQTLKIFVLLFSGTVRPTQLKLGTHMYSGWMYRVYRHETTTAYSSLNFFICLSFQFSNIKGFRRTFLRDCEAYKFETWYTRVQWVDVSCLPELGSCCLFVPLFLHLAFFSNFQTLNIFVALFSGTVRPTKLKLDAHVYSG